MADLAVLIYRRDTIRVDGHNGPMSEYVSLKQLADRLGMDRSHARRFVLRLGYKPVKRRNPDSGNQLALAVTAEEADKIVQAREERGFLAAEHDAVPNEYGVFYAIQLVPELDPLRMKLGFASTIEERLAQHRTAAPTATVLKTWPCRRSWERAAMDCLTQGYRHIGGEVYECTNIDEVRDRGDAFFALMPTLSNENNGAG